MHQRVNSLMHLTSFFIIIFSRFIFLQNAKLWVIYTHKNVNALKKVCPFRMVDRDIRSHRFIKIRLRLLCQVIESKSCAINTGFQYFFSI